MTFQGTRLCFSYSKRYHLQGARFVPQKNQLVCQTKKHNSVEFYDLNGPKFIKSIKNNHDYTIILSADGAYFAKITTHTVNIFHCESKRCLKLLHVRDRPSDASFSPSNNLIAVTNERGQVFIYDIRDILTKYQLHPKSYKNREQPLKTVQINVSWYSTQHSGAIFHDENDLIFSTKGLIQILHWKEGLIETLVNLHSNIVIHDIPIHKKYLIIDDYGHTNVGLYNFDTREIKTYKRANNHIGTILIDDKLHLLQFQKDTLQLVNAETNHCVRQFKTWTPPTLFHACQIYIAVDKFNHVTTVYKILDFHCAANVVCCFGNVAPYILLDIANFLEAKMRQISFQDESNAFQKKKIDFIGNLKIFFKK